MVTTLVLATATGAFVFVLVAASRDRERIARALLWLSFFGPYLVGTHGNLERSTALSAHALLQVVISSGCLATGIALSRPRRRGASTPELLLAVFLGLCFFSASWSRDAEATLLKATVLALQWIAIVAVVRRYSSYRECTVALAHVCHLVLLATAAGVLVAPGKALSASATAWRLQGVYPSVHPNVLGLLAVIVLLALITGVTPTWLASRASLLPLVSALYLAVLVASRARGALIVGAVVIACVLARSAFRRTVAGMLLVGVIATMSALAAMQMDRLSEYFRRGQDGRGLSTMSGRTDIWDSALQLWRERPLNGYGYYVGHRLDVGEALYRGINVSNLDNMWVEALVDVGVVGAAVLALMLLTGIRRAIRHAREADEGHGLFVAAACALLSVATLFNPSLQTVTLIAMVFGVLLMGSFRSVGDFGPDRSRAKGPARIGAALPHSVSVH